MTPQERALERIRILANRLTLEAYSAGVVLTIETQPKKPLAMGHHRMVVDVRLQRELAKGRKS